MIIRTIHLISSTLHEFETELDTSNEDDLHE